MKRIIYLLLTLLIPLKAWSEVRIGWQIPWALQGQLVQVLKNTEILNKNDIKAKFIGRSFGPELNELAVADEVDVILTGDQPGITLLARSKDWKVLARLMYNRTAVYVPIDSAIKSAKALKAKKIGVPMGAAAERNLIEFLKKEKLNPSDSILVNLDIKEQIPLIKANQKKKTWGDFDALTGFDPIPAILESQSLARMIDVAPVVSLVLVNQKWIDKNPGSAEKIISAFKDAYSYYSENMTIADTWFLKESQLSGADPKALALANSLEPNLKAKSKNDMRFWLNKQDLIILDKASDFLESKFKKPFPYKSSLLPTALEPKKD